MFSLRRNCVWAIALSCALLSCAALARAEGGGANLASTPTRLRGATSLQSSASGLVALGGERLRFLPRGGGRWMTLHQVRGDSLYRVGVDDAGRLLAAWEEETVFHYFDLGTSRHITIPKPVNPSPSQFADYIVEGLELSPDGRAALVHMSGLRTSGATHQAIYRVVLEANATPQLLYRTDGQTLDFSPRGAAFTVPASISQQCTFHGCAPIARIVAVDFTARGAVEHTLAGREVAGMLVESTSFLRKSADDRFALDIRLRLPPPQRGPSTRAHLRYRYGDATAQIMQVNEPRGRSDADVMMLASNNDIVEVRPSGHAWNGTGRDGSIEIEHWRANGTHDTTRVPPLPRQRWAFTVQSIGERADGSLWLLWGGELIVFSNGAPRRLSIDRTLGRGTEWAGVGIYVREPESLWVGIEIGGRRDYANVNLSDADRRAVAWGDASNASPSVAVAAPSIASLLRNVATILPAGPGMVALGTPALLYRANGESEFRSLHNVPGDRLYRIVADASGRILAGWSQEPRIHLFDPSRNQHLVLPRPAKPTGFEWVNLDSLHFATNGDALIYMRGSVHASSPGFTGPMFVTLAYRLPLREGATPQLLFREDGHGLYASPRGAVVAVPMRPGEGCDHQRCYFAAIVANEITDRGIRRRVILDGHTNMMGLARIVAGSNDERIAVAVEGSIPRPGASRSAYQARGLVHYRWGESTGTLRYVDGPMHWSDVLGSRLLSSGALLEIRRTDDNSIVIVLDRGDRAPRVTPLPRIPRGRIDDSHDLHVYGVAERAGGGLYAHIGNHLVLFGDHESPRRYSLASRLGRGQEWAGADIYTASPERLQIGIEQGATRHFIELPFIEIERRAQPMR